MRRGEWPRPQDQRRRALRDCRGSGALRPSRVHAWRALSRCALRSLYIIRSGSMEKYRMALRTREIYRSPNGDRWSLAVDTETGRVFVRYEPTCPQAVKWPISRSEPFLSPPATDQRSRNFCGWLQRWSRVRRPQGPKGDKRHLKKRRG